MEAVGTSLCKIQESLAAMTGEINTMRSDVERELDSVHKRLDKVEQQAATAPAHDPEWVRAI